MQLFYMKLIETRDSTFFIDTDVRLNGHRRVSIKHIYIQIDNV